ncbi:MAG: D-hexose-6-phosphate mutarotase [Methylococcaceae bacterium]|nr:D-hexose-6-phosphate mutarotase [Methylococcaceae bacterium]
MIDIPALNHRFGRPGEIHFREGPGGLTLVEVRNDQAEATIVLQGAHLIDWTPHGQTSVIWLSSCARFAEGRSIRGGIPVCWPWFGPHATESGFPSHGFARTAPWEVVETGRREDGASHLAFRLTQDEASFLQWPHSTSLELRFWVGHSLEMELSTFNLEPVPLTISQALHSYFRVGDVRRIKVLGLEGCRYIDKVDGGLHKRQEGPVSFASEVDRIYLEATGDCLIDDPQFERRIRIAKRGSASTVVWNPWFEKSQKLGDLGDDAYLGMVCLESANTAEDVAVIAPGERHRLGVCYGLEAG